MAKENPPVIDKGKSVVYVDGLGREHDALVTAVNELHEGMLTIVFIDVNAPEPDNVHKIFDVQHVSMVEEPNADLPNYQVNCWKAFYEGHRPLPEDHPAFDHPFKEPEYDEAGIRIQPDRPQTMAEIIAHQNSQPATAPSLPSSDVPSPEDLDKLADEQTAKEATSASASVIETKQYSDGSSATGVAPLPDVSPGQQAAAEAQTSAQPPAAEEGQTE